MKSRVVFAATPIVLGASALVGWIAGIELLTNFQPGLPTMKPVTALAFVLAGLALVVTTPSQRNLSRRLAGLAPIFGIAVILIAAACLFQIFSGSDVGTKLNSLGFSMPGDQSGQWMMAPATAFNMLVAGVGISVLGIRRSGRAVIFAAHVGAVLISVVALFALTIFVVHVDALQRVMWFESMSAPTVIAFGAVSAAMLQTRALQGWLGFIANVPVRQALAIVAPMTVAIPLTVGIGAILALRSRLIDDDHAIPLIVCLTGLFLIILVWTAALFVGKAEGAIVDWGVKQEDRANLSDAETLRTVELLHHGQKMQLLGEMVGSLSHDFKNFVSVIQVSADALAANSGTEEERARHLAAIGKSAINAAELSGRLLSFSYIRPLRSELVDLRQIVSGIADILRYSMGNRIELVLEIADDLWPVRIDPSQFEVALLNLAINARDAIAGRGKLTVALTNSAPGADGNVIVSISDTGVGMPPDVLAHAHEPFFSTKPDGSGTGLGLNQVREFLAESRGEMLIESKLGEGTTIILSIPRCHPNEGKFIAPTLFERMKTRRTG